HNPVDVRVYGFWNPMRTGWMQSPLQVIALDDDRAGHFAIGATLELRTDVDQPCAVPDRLLRLPRTEPSQPGASTSEKAVETEIATGSSGPHHIVQRSIACLRRVCAAAASAARA